MRHIPNIITSMNLLSGFAALIFILAGSPDTACILIAAAMVFDFLDGMASRLLNAYSDIGKELDSLADMVSFGVVPGLLIYTLLAGKTDGEVNFFYLAVSALFPVCAALRLAKFNTDSEQSVSFKGLPTPAGALAVISLVMASAFSDNEIVKNFAESNTAVAIFNIIISLLMVSRFPMLSLKIKNMNFRGNEARYILVLVCIIQITLFGFSGLPLIIPAYIAVSVAWSLF